MDGEGRELIMCNSLSTTFHFYAIRFEEYAYDLVNFKNIETKVKGD